MSKTWSEIFHGYQYGEQIDMAIENRSSSPMSEWTIVLKMDPDCMIDSYWNGEYYYDEASNINQSLITFANTIDAKDSYTKGHSQRVAWYSRELARRMELDEDFCQNIFYVGLLHDIGKIGVQDAILKKSAKLTYDEFNEIKEHTSMGGDILKGFNAIEVRWMRVLRLLS